MTKEEILAEISECYNRRNVLIPEANRFRKQAMDNPRSSAMAFWKQAQALVWENEDRIVRLMEAVTLLDE